MTIWLAKTDPEHLSLNDIEKAGTVVWKKVRHPKAMQFMQQMQKGDLLLVYHSNEKKIVGLVEVVANNPDPDHLRGRLIDVKFIKQFSKPYVTLENVKKSGKFNDFRLVKEPRLSIMDVPRNFLRHFNIKI